MNELKTVTRAPRGTARARNKPRSHDQPAAKISALPMRLVPPPARNGELRALTFHYFDLAARQVAVAGSFNGWRPQPMHRIGNEWTLELLLAPGRYEYRFLVDETWKDDPMAAAYISNPFGSLNSVLEVNPAKPWVGAHASRVPVPGA